MVIGMIVGQCHHQHHHHPHRHHHHHSLHRQGRSNSDETQSTGSGNSSSSPSEYSLAMSSESGGEGRRSRHHSTASLIDSIEKRTQRTYRYGIGLVCVGATLNWLGFAQGTTFIDPLRYLGVACVLTGSFCVCLAMCRWLGRPISVSGHHVSSLEEERGSGDVHVINVAVPMYVPSLTGEDYRPTKPPDYEQIVATEPPPYDEAIKLTPGIFFSSPGENNGTSANNTVVVEDGTQTDHLFASQLASAPSPSYHDYDSPSHANTNLTKSLFDDHHRSQDTRDSQRLPFPRDSSETKVMVYEVSPPPPAYEPSPTHITSNSSSCSSSTPLIPPSSGTSRFDLPPSFSVRRLFGTVVSASNSPNSSPPALRNTGHCDLVNVDEHLHEVHLEHSEANIV